MHEALDEQLSGDMCRHGAERGAHGELRPPRIGPHEHEVRDVGARDQQHRADRAHEHPERAGDTADHVVLERPHDGVIRQFCIASRVTLYPCTIGHASSQIGTMR